MNYENATHDLDFPGSPDLYDSGFDLRTMLDVDMKRLLDELRVADVVVCVSPDGTYVLLPPGEKIVRGAADRAALRYLVVQVANDPQADALLGIRLAMETIPLASLASLATYLLTEAIQGQARLDLLMARS